jgi:hypothetical protein
MLALQIPVLGSYLPLRWVQCREQCAKTVSIYPERIWIGFGINNPSAQSGLAQRVRAKSGPMTGSGVIRRLRDESSIAIRIEQISGIVT